MKQQIFFVTGKGGVGKSLVAASLAHKKAKEGFRTLLVELGDQSFFENFFKISSVTYKPVPLEKNLDLALWSGAECLKEYALHLLKVESLYRLFFENRVSKTLINVAPGLQELSVLGKITSGPRGHGPPAQHEVLVVDAYATGHFLSLIRAPRGMSEAISYGPMGEQSRSIDRTIRQAEICHYYYVTLPEELPMKETQELDEVIQREFGIRGKWLVNRTLETTLRSKDLQGAGEKERGVKMSFEAYLKTLLERQERFFSLLNEKKISWQPLPFVIEDDPWKLVENLSERIGL